MSQTESPWVGIQRCVSTGSRGNDRAHQNGTGLTSLCADSLDCCFGEKPQLTLTQISFFLSCRRTVPPLPPPPPFLSQFFLFDSVSFHSESSVFFVPLEDVGWDECKHLASLQNSVPGREMLYNLVSGLGLIQTFYFYSHFISSVG